MVGSEARFKVLVEFGTSQPSHGSLSLSALSPILDTIWIIDSAKNWLNPVNLVVIPG